MATMVEKARRAQPARSDDAEQSLITSHVVTLDPSAACDMLGSHYYPNQRPLRETHVRKLMREMNKGTFRPEALQVCVVGAHRYLVDGQHRLNALIRAQKTYTFPVSVYVYDSLAEVDAHYSVAGIPRLKQLGDLPVVRALSNELGLGASDTRYVLAAALMLSLGFEVGVEKGNQAFLRLVTLEDRLDIARSFRHELGEAFGVMAAGAPSMRAHGRIASVLSIMLVTLRDQKPKARSFWESVFTLSGLTKGSGPYHLVNLLNSRNAQQRVGVGYARTVARCWNFYYDGETREALIRPMIERPILIAGTHYDGQNIRRLVALPDL